jgi:chorismate mutase/prephenate dehydratase
MILNETVDFAVLPIENTLHGIVGETVDLLGKTGRPLIVGEIVIPIHFVFASRADDLAGIRKIYSKQESFLQCSGFLNQPALGKAERTASTSTAEAARLAATDEHAAALCPDIAATLAGVPIRFRNIENNAQNKTRFLVLGRPQPKPTGRDKTSVFARVPNVSGGLVGLLKSFSDHGINLVKIESRPMDDAANFETWFSIDFDGHMDQENVRRMIEQHSLTWLGSYPRYADERPDA